MRISTTTIESFRLFMEPDNEWMPESDLLDTIRGLWKPNHKVLLGQAFGACLETPERYRVSGGYRVPDRDGRDVFEFGDDVMGPALAVVHRDGIFEAKSIGVYGPHEVVAKADHLHGSALSEFKTTLSPFEFDKYAKSYQWRFMADIFQPASITYHVFCLDEGSNGVISLKGIETFNLYPYVALRHDCEDMVRRFAEYATARGVAGILDERQRSAA